MCCLELCDCVGSQWGRTGAKENRGWCANGPGQVWQGCFLTALFPSGTQMRYTRRVSVWPVAFVGGLRYESPKVSPAGKVVGWKTVFDPNRPFAIDMAGFAISIKLILEKPQASFKLEGVKGGYQETSLLKDLVTMDGLEPKAANCTKVSITRDLESTSPLLDPGRFRGLLPCPIHLLPCLLCASTPQLRTVPRQAGRACQMLYR